MRASSPIANLSASIAHTKPHTSSRAEQRQDLTYTASNAQASTYIGVETNPYQSYLISIIPLQAPFPLCRTVRHTSNHLADFPHALALLLPIISRHTNVRNQFHSLHCASLERGIKHDNGYYSAGRLL